MELEAWTLELALYTMSLWPTFTQTNFLIRQRGSRLLDEAKLASSVMTEVFPDEGFPPGLRREFGW